MMKYNEDEIANLRERARAYDDAAQERFQETLDATDDPQADFVCDLLNETEKSELYHHVHAELEDGKRPSQVIAEQLDWLFGSFILPRRRACVLYAADHGERWAYATEHAGRRSFRSRAPQVMFSQLVNLLRWFIAHDKVDADSLALLRGEVGEDEKAFIIRRRVVLPPCQVAYEIDSGNAAFIEEVRAVILGESEADIDPFLIRGVLQSSHAELHELLGKLLLAARLQEGLRQAICENADMGTVEGMLCIMRVIHEHGLIRYSSVKRAFGVWTGLIANLYDARAADLERISEKTEALAWTLLTDESARAAALQTEDSMQIYLALWACGVYEAQEAAAQMRRLSEQGTHHQLLTACYALRAFCEPQFAHAVATDIMARHRREPDILATCMPSFMPRLWAALREAAGRKSKGQRPRPRLERYFADRAQVELFFDLLLDVYAGIKGKKSEFSPCIFPWNRERLEKEDVSCRLCWIAAALQDDARIDRVLDLLPDISYERKDYIRLLLTRPQTPKQQRTLVALVGDKQEDARRQAFALLRTMELTVEHYALVESMLRYKNADMRDMLLTLMLRQEDAALAAAVERLLADKLEEKRTAGLDIVLRLGKDEARQELCAQCSSLVSHCQFTTSKEQLLAAQIVPAEAASAPSALYDGSESYEPELDADYLAQGEALFHQYFPQPGLLERLRGKIADFEPVIEKLRALMQEHEADEYKTTYGTETLGTGSIYMRWEDDGSYTIPFAELWDAFYEAEIRTPVLAMRAFMALLAEGDHDECARRHAEYVKRLIGNGFSRRRNVPQFENLVAVFKYYQEKFGNKEELRKLSAYVAWRLSQEDRLDVECRYKRWNDSTGKGRYSVLDCPQVELLLSGLNERPAAEITTLFPICWKLQQTKGWYAGEHGVDSRCGPFFVSIHGYSELKAEDFLRAAHAGLISEAMMNRCMLEHLGDKSGRDEVDALHFLSNVARGGRDADRLAQTPGLLPFSLLAYEKVMAAVLGEELGRGESQTRYSRHIFRITCVRGAGYYTRILAALGREPLSRNRGRRWSHDEDNPRRECLSHLLEVSRPAEGDSAESLRALVQQTDIREERLIEASIYSPEWLRITEEYLGWPGFTSACYYFMAHTSEDFDAQREALIARYTPLSKEELNNGAFDLNWFRAVHEQLGEKRFNLIYKAAKYSADGAKHTRARKYADAATGKLDAAATQVEIAAKRNKDLLMAWGIIPLTTEAELMQRYLYLQQFAGESRKFGAQRLASETTAVAMALRNLAANAGYADAHYLCLRMESQLMEGIRPLLEEKPLGEYNLRLMIDEQGCADILCTKGGKALKSIPAKLKKEAHVLLLGETKKQLAEQRVRTRQMLELAMEDGCEYGFAELSALLQNPVAAALLQNLVFVGEGQAGYLCTEGLRGPEGALRPLPAGAALRVAHPYDLYAAGNWAAFQRDLFARGVVQPFRQVFRELYVKTPEEAAANHSRRYAGHQVQPKKMLACLKTRRWVADYENGLQKVFYRENIVARIYALADWFTPSDIEAPMLEWVEFYDRRSNEQLEICRIPDILFSEVMRDVDLAVSVAHAGGVDPETSHSTIEMRAALLRFTLPLFKMDNVEIIGSHAHICGTRADYTLHLGSGVVHQKGGTMLSILPVHGQHRGKLFLPFADDDPKTAEILSKALLLAEDAKLQDPTILRQLNR